MDRHESHRVVGGGEVEDPEVGDHVADLVEAGGRRSGGGGARVADTRHHVDLLDEGAGRVVRHPVAGRVVDRVAGRAAHPDQLRLGPFPWADGADVLVAGAVDLGRHHDQVATTGPDDVEHPAVGHVGLEDERRRRRSERRRAVDQGGVAVRQDEVGGEGEAGQPGAEGGCRPEGAGHHLAVAAEDVRTGDGAVLGPGDSGGGGVGHAPSLTALAAARSSVASRTAVW